MTIVREFFLKDSGIEELWPHVFALGIFAVIVMTAAVLRLKKNID